MRARTYRSGIRILQRSGRFLTTFRRGFAAYAWNTLRTLFGIMCRNNVPSCSDRSNIVIFVFSILENPLGHKVSPKPPRRNRKLESVTYRQTDSSRLLYRISCIMQATYQLIPSVMLCMMHCVSCLIMMMTLELAFVIPK